MPLPLMAVIPKVRARTEQGVRRHVLDHPYSRATEAVRSLVMQLSMRVHDGGSRSALPLPPPGRRKARARWRCGWRPSPAGVDRRCW
ncbi:hypothetical protein RAA17_09595 [Komagataeibacter rhaeticus]|nr:hypothetical protein [Komagataeibacter rhaeticus]